MAGDHIIAICNAVSRCSLYLLIAGGSDGAF
jgi:hypothetical protein